MFPSVSTVVTDTSHAGCHSLPSLISSPYSLQAFHCTEMYTRAATLPHLTRSLLWTVAIFCTMQPTIPWSCLPNSSSMCLVFFPLSLCLASWFWPDLMKGRHVHTTAVCVSVPWSGSLHVVRLPAGSWHIREWTGLECAKSQRAVENREIWRKLVAKSSVVPQRPLWLRDRWWWWWRWWWPTMTYLIKNGQ